MPCWSAATATRWSAQIADLYIARRDMLLGVGLKRGITISAPTNEDVGRHQPGDPRAAEGRGEIGSRRDRLQGDRPARRRPMTWPIATGDRVRLFRRTWGTVDGSEQPGRQQRRHRRGARRKRPTACVSGRKDGEVADIDWRRLADKETGRLLLGLGHALTIDAAQGLTSDEHINALPRGTSGVTAFTSYVAESRAAARPGR